MIKLLDGITSRLNMADVEVNRLELLDNTLDIEGVITVDDVSNDLDYDYDYQVTTRDDVRHYFEVESAIEAVVEEIQLIENFKPGSMVEKDGERFMLVPTEFYNDSFYLLNLITFQLDHDEMHKVELYESDYYNVPTK